ncbi:methyltransferase domain-containing protein [Halobacillus litoralis]|uniref:class I SAM-dependent methyltransferase n=1 Tax=Halobacillus litoralis TaxID=45668 RepID=UPI001CD2DB4B|nr:class I SAM-dependent methyltransferase [Halobacillus litoralis]MCA0971472.1 methyltransferase domain-containing protein [Halobacillus litoralis]
MKNDYLELLALFGIGGAHPGGLPLTKKVFETVSLTDVQDVLEIGCGTGQTSAYLVEQYSWNVTGVDRHPLMIQKARHRLSGVAFCEGNAENLDFSDGQFDLVLSESVLSFTSVRESLPEAARVLKEKGTMIAIEMTAERDLDDHWTSVIDDLYGINHVLQEVEWKEKLLEAGFSSVDVVYTPDSLEETPVIDLQPSEVIEEKWYDLWDQHAALTAQADLPLKYRVYVCTK